ncbi:hypothetical protein GE09DRAFT_347408 [Coniochaeta sp. 2T2.1]|nr:hypothetical protein GE09DRAFT_347408 [Coniochaeta sp. 2T2.1]
MRLVRCFSAILSITYAPVVRNKQECGLLCHSHAINTISCTIIQALFQRDVVACEVRRTVIQRLTSFAIQESQGTFRSSSSSQGHAF